MADKNHKNDLPSCYGIIPARFNSKRFPGKPLADILGRPMIWHVFERARQCSALSKVILATDNARIQAAAEKFDIPVVMTRTDHPSGTDRVLEAAQKLELPLDSVVVNIQGDEPALNPAMLAELLQPFSVAEIQVTTLARKISAAEAQTPDLVKVVFGAQGRALYFSRSPIPYHRDLQNNIHHGHIGIYAFRMPVLQKFVALPQGRLEVTEKLEQLRMLENDIPIHIVLTNHRSVSVDRPEDIETVSKIILEQERS
ncbi:MAG: 3-deoxy-manno-octulosonate cytidylyltransferase [Desulfobacterales bacterium]|nr:MAG: 3-deoxy-manno-octulosonate cytidylyltransferase [Desulfobacterales bacterium]